MSAELTTQSHVKEFQKLFTEGMSHLYDACVSYVTAIRKDPNAKAEFAKAMPQIPPGAWNRFERIGSGEIDPRLMLPATPAQAALCRLPLSEQQRVLNEGAVEVLIAKNGETETLRVAIDNLTPQQTRQVIGGRQVRDAAAQRAFIESESTANRIKTVEAFSPYEISRGRLIISKPVIFTREEVAAILHKMVA